MYVSKSSHRTITLFLVFIGWLSKGVAQNTTNVPANDTLLSVSFNFQRLLERLEQIRPQGATMSKDGAMQLDMIRRLGLSSAELHVIHDPEEVFALAIAVYDPEQKLFKEMTGTESGKQFFESTPAGLRPKWETATPQKENPQPPPPTQFKRILFKPMGKFLVGAKPELMQKIESDHWNITNQVAHLMTNRVKTQTSLATISISLPEQRNLDWLNKIKAQEEIKNNLGAAMMLGVFEAFAKKLIEKFDTTNAFALSIDLDENKRRQVKYCQYLKTPEAVKSLFDALNTKPAKPSPTDTGAKAFANVLHNPGINKSLTHNQWFLNIQMDWGEEQDQLFKRSARESMGKVSPPIAATPPPPPPPKSPPDAPKEELALAEKISMTIPLQIETKPFKIGDKQLQAEIIRISGKEFLGERSMDLFKDVEVIGNKMYIVVKNGEIHAFNIIEGTPPQLSIDTSFGEQGIVKTESRIERLSRDHRGNLVTTVRFGESVFIDATGKITNRGRTSGNLSMHPTQPWGISYHFSRINKVDANAPELVMSDWTMTSNQPSDEDGDHFSFLSPVIIDSNRVIVGCQVPVGERQAHNVAVFDYNGKEQFRFGNTKEVFEPDGFCYLHDIASHPNGIITVDSNCRKIAFWSNTGEFLGVAEADKALGVRYPWMPGCTVDTNGNFYLVLAQERKNKEGTSRDIEVTEGVIYRIKGF